MSERDERDEMIESLPRWADCSRPPPGQPNAFVFIDDSGRLNILPVDGGWLGVEPQYFAILQADIAPFHG